MCRIYRPIYYITQNIITQISESAVKIYISGFMNFQYQCLTATGTNNYYNKLQLSIDRAIGHIVWIFTTYLFWNTKPTCSVIKDKGCIKISTYWQRIYVSFLQRCDLQLQLLPKKRGLMSEIWYLHCNLRHFFFVRYAYANSEADRPT